MRSKTTNWIRRDLRVILGLQDVEIVVEYVLAVLEKHALQTEQAMALLRPYLRDKTDLFVHELVGFMRSRLTIDAYDLVAQYENVSGAGSSSESGSGSVREVGLTDA
ncbi:hypothetical protein HDU98_005460, partial [Podochytrium sp. JEL0797]